MIIILIIIVLAAPFIGYSIYRLKQSTKQQEAFTRRLILTIDATDIKLDKVLHSK